MMQTRYPDAIVSVDLTGPNGNAFAILGATKKALDEIGATPHEVAIYLNDATSGDYDHLLDVTRQWVSLREE